MKTKAIKTIIDNTLIPHTAFRSASSRIEQCFNSACRSSEPIGIAVVGESRTGKTRVLEEFAVKYPAKRVADGLQMPVLRAKAPAEPTVKGLVEVMLHELKDPRADKGSAQTRTTRLRKLIAETGTRAVLIDEFQHFYDQGKHRVIHHVANWLKNLVEDEKLVLIVAGLETCMSVITQNEQLTGRFLAPIRMPRFNWEDDDDREEFIGILGAFQDTISKHFEIPDLTTPEMAFRFYCGTGGLMGYLTKVLRTAIWNAMDAERSRITLRNFAEAHSQSVWNHMKLPSASAPFDARFTIEPTAVLLNAVASIGTPGKPPIGAARHGRQ